MADARTLASGVHVPSVFLPKHSVGMVHALEFALEFKAWADAQRQLTWEAIATRWGVSRATAYRWLGAYQRVRERAAA